MDQLLLKVIVHVFMCCLDSLVHCEAVKTLRMRKLPVIPSWELPQVIPQLLPSLLAL